MLRIPRILTRAKDKKQVVLSFNLTQKIILTLLVAALATVPLCFGLARVHSAPSAPVSPPPSPTPSVTIAAPAQALIGTQVKFKVTFTNGTALGYGPILDVVMDAGGKDGGNPSCTCDGITFVSAQMVGVNGGPIPLTPLAALTAPCGSAPNPITHPFASSGVLPVTVPAGSQLITLALPFGSFQPNQPPIEVEITANISINADAGYPLNISARGGFRFGTQTPLDDHVPDPPVFSDEVPLGNQVVNSPAWIAQATITPAVMIINKRYLGPEGENATGPNFIGYYPLRYSLTVQVAPGQTVTNVVLTDCLPDNMAFHQLVSVTPAATSTTLPPVDIATSSGCLTVNWNSLSGSAAVVFEFFIPEKDAQGNPVLPADCTPAISKDSLKIEADWTPVDPCDGPLQHLSEGPVVDTLLDKCIAIQKSVAMFTDTGAPGYTPGDTVEYTLNFQISDYKTFSALDITDSLGDGQKLVGSAPTLVVKDQFGTVSGNFTLGSDLISAPYNGSDCGQAVGGTKLTFLVSQKMINLTPPNTLHAAGILTGGFATTPSSSTPATGQIVFHAEILDKFAVTQQPGDQFVDKEDPISNCVVIGGKLMTNVNPPVLPTSTGVDGHDDSGTTISIVGDTLKKTVYAVKRANNFGVFNPVCGPPSGVGGTTCSNSPNPPQEVRPGDRVTYRLEKVVPSSDAENLVIEDWLPKPTYTVVGINFANSFCTGIPTPGNSCLGPGDQMHGLPLAPTVSAITATNGIKFDYGTFNDTTNTPRKIDLLFTYQVTNFPFADELFLTNEARECETNTFGTPFCQVAIAQVNLRQPNLKIHKGTIATSNGFGEFTHQGPQTTNLSLAQAPTGATFSLTGISGVVNSGAIALMDSNLSNVDANDIVTFAITIENLGGSPAYDVKIEDIIPTSSGVPSCFTIVPGSIVVKRGTGVVVPPLFYSIQPANPGSTTTSFTITSTPNVPISAFNAASGANIVTVTFQAKLLANVMPGCCDNTVNLLHYSSTINGPDFVAANLTPPFTDTANVCVKPKLTKSLITTSEAHTLGTDVTIGEIVRYRLVVQLPETGLLTNFQVTDALPAGLKFRNDGTARIAFVSNGPGIFHPSFGPPFGPPFNVVGNQGTLPGLTLSASQTITTGITVGSSCGDDPTFSLGNIKNNNSDSDLEYIVIEFNALVCNEAGNQNGTPLSNTFSVSVGGTQIATSNPINVIIVEPNFTMTKTVAPNPAVKGQTLTYTVQYTNNGTADAFNVELKDTLPPGLTLGTVAASCPFTTGGNVITMTCAQVPKAPGSGSTVIVTYQAVADPATCPVKLTNQANLTWTSLSGLQGTTVNPTGSSTPGNSGAVDGERDGVTPLLTLNDYATTASAAVKIDCPCEAMITGMKFNDLNGNGIRDAGEPGLANWTIQVTNSTGNTQTTTTDSAGNYSLTVPAPGSYTVAEVLQSGWTQTAPTTGTYSVTVSPGQVITNFNFGNKKQTGCDLEIKKEVKPNPLVSGQQATAIITVKNVGTGPCHGPTQVAESMPAGLTLVSASVPGGNCVVSSGVCTYPPAIPSGVSVVFTYVFNVTAPPGASFENCAKLKNSEDTNPTNNGACVPVTVSGSMLPDLTIQKKVQCGGPAIPQGTCNVVLTITNNGPGSFNGILAVQDLVTPPPSPALSLIGSSPGWSCSTGPPNNIGCNTNGSVSLAPGQSTTLSLSIKIPGGQFKNCANVKGHTQFPFNASTLIQEGNYNNNESCVSMGGSASGDCPTVPLRLFNTGVADNGSLLASGATDPHYVLLNTSPVSPNALVLFPNQIGGYVANSATSQWLGPDPPGSNGGQGGFYTYRTTFTLDCDPSTAAISGQWATDNEAEIFLNGSPTGVITGPGDFIAFKSFVITSGFTSGVNTLDFRVRNRLSSLGSPTPTGMQVQMKGTVKCCSATGSLTVIKTVENLSPSPIPAGTSFPITVTCLPSGPNVTLNLAAGGNQTLNNIPVGSKCTVTEGPLPPPVSSPVCASLQWSAPTYSPGQSVTISNSGSPQTVTIQNHFTCVAKHPVDAYAFTRGMNEFCVWGGGGSGSYNSPNLIGNADSPLFNSPTLVRNSGGVKFGAVGLCYGRILSANDKVAFKYTFNAIPAGVLSYPDVNPVLRPGGVFSVLETRRNVFGGGLSPIGLQLYFRPQKRIKPFVSTSGGFIFFNEQVPRLNGAQFNFTYDVGGGVQVFGNSQRAFTFGYKYQRLSNGGRALNNPGFNGNIFYLGYSIFK